MSDVKFSRVFAMPTRWTFELAPVAEVLSRYITGVVVDPFSGHSTRATHSNDLSPESPADSHVDARVFLENLFCTGVRADTVLLDPPYSPRQIAECYKSVGRAIGTEDTQNARLYAESKNAMDELLKPCGVAICCGWNSGGFGVTRGYELIEVLLVNHGAAHNDTIVTVERKWGQP